LSLLLRPFPYSTSSFHSVPCLLRSPSFTTPQNPNLHYDQDPTGQKTQVTGTSAFTKDGAIDSVFKANGAIGGTADKVGGPFAKDGAIIWVESLFESHPNISWLLWWMLFALWLEFVLSRLEDLTVLGEGKEL
jgi:hypothetical protein